MTIVIDASAVVAAAFGEANPDLVEATLTAIGGGELVAPWLMPVEVAGAIAKAEWTSSLPAASANTAFAFAREALEHVEVVTRIDLKDHFATCRAHSLRGADAAYLILAVDRQAALLTGDKALARAAQVAGVDLVFDPSA